LCSTEKFVGELSIIASETALTGGVGVGEGILQADMNTLKEERGIFKNYN
jgi:hypothetical protein